MELTRLAARSGALILALSSLAFVGCSGDGDDNNDVTGLDTFGTTLQSSGFSTLAGLLDQSGLIDSFDSGGPFTVFGPTDAAFDALPEGFIDGLSQEELVEFLNYHVTFGSPSFADIAALDQIETLGGQSVLVSQFGGDGGTLFLNDVAIQAGAIETNNGQIFPLPGVLTLPTDLSSTLADRGFGTLATALTAAGLDEELFGSTGVTLIAPTDEAFAALPDGVLDQLLLPENQAQLEGLLRYHVLEGDVNIGPAVTTGDLRTADGRVIHFGLDAAQSPRVNQRSLSTVNVPTTNGILHGVDSVLVQPQVLGDSILGTQFSLGTQIAGVLETFNNEDEEFTLFLPQDQSLIEFVLTQPTIANFLIDPSNQDALATTILNQFVPGVQSSQDVLAAASFTSLANDGSELAVGSDGTTTSIGGIPIVATDLVASNGIVHLIDGLILPDSIDFPEGPASVVDSDRAFGGGFDGTATEFLERFELAAAGAIESQTFADGLAQKLGRAPSRVAALAPGDLLGLASAALGSTEVISLVDMASFRFDEPSEALEPAFATEALSRSLAFQTEQGELTLELLPFEGSGLLALWSEAAPMLSEFAPELLVPLADGSYLSVLRVALDETGTVEFTFDQGGFVLAELAIF